MLILLSTLTICKLLEYILNTYENTTSKFCFKSYNNNGQFSRDNLRVLETTIY